MASKQPTVHHSRSTISLRSAVFGPAGIGKNISTWQQPARSGFALLSTFNASALLLLSAAFEGLPQDLEDAACLEEWGFCNDCAGF